MSSELKLETAYDTRVTPQESRDGVIPLPHEARAPLSVLVIEDDAVDAAYLNRVLEKLQSFRARVEVVSEPAAIRKALRSFKGDLIIADLMLNGDTSISYLSELSGVADRAPVLLLTGLDGSDVQEMAFRAGIDAFISKSDLEPRLLETLVRTALHTSQMRRRFLQTDYQRNRDLYQTMALHSATPPTSDLLTGLRARMSLHRSFR